MRYEPDGSHALSEKDQENKFIWEEPGFQRVPEIVSMKFLSSLPCFFSKQRCRSVLVSFFWIDAFIEKSKIIPKFQTVSILRWQPLDSEKYSTDK